MDIVIIAHFITEFAKDGTSRFVYIAEHLSKQNNVELITSGFDHTKKKQRERVPFELQSKVTLLEEPSYYKNVCLQRFISHAHFGKEVRKYLESRKKPDVIYCAVPSLDCAYYAAKYAKKHNIRFIIDVQDLWPEAFKMVLNVPIISDMIFYPMKKKADFIYSCADAIVGVSKAYCNRAKTVNDKYVQCVPVFLGTKLSKFDEYVSKNRVVRTDDKFIIGYCGTLGHSYDIKCVLNAMLDLREKGYNNISFWVMGDGPLKTEFEEYAKSNNLDVVFYGRVPYEKMCGLLAACDACINPIVATSVASIINKHGDYAAAGIPVINTQASDEYRSLICEYNCGINCCPSSVEEVSAAILNLIDFPQQKEFMGKNARILAEEKFDRDVSYIRILEAICQD